MNLSNVGENERRTGILYHLKTDRGRAATIKAVKRFCHPATSRPHVKWGCCSLIVFILLIVFVAVRYDFDSTKIGGKLTEFGNKGLLNDDDIEAVKNETNTFFWKRNYNLDTELKLRSFHPAVIRELEGKLIGSELLGIKHGLLHGKYGLDFKGNPLWKEMPLVFKQTKQQKVEAHTGYCFNTRVSQSIPLDREVPDFNSDLCRAFEYPKDLPEGSVIIVFYNEDLSVLLRSFHSVLNRTPPELLREIIIVDDFSNKTTHPWLGAELENYVKHVPKVVLKRLPSRHGLMLARLSGLEWATGEVVIFLDSHIEAGQRWMEPLLYATSKNKRDIVTPFIHTIDANDFNLLSHAVTAVAFTWMMGQAHPNIPNSEFEPMESPIMAGGLFAANKQWFLDLGGYDSEMRLYGGEELEIGFKTWMCGGELHALPCSHVGHVFRSKEFWDEQVYAVPGYEIHRNKLRVAAVWMDQYEKVVKCTIPQLPPNMSLGSLEEPKAVRERLQCKSFDWYLNRVAPDMYKPKLDGGKAGALRVEKLGACIDNLGMQHPGTRIGAYPCHNQLGTQAFLHDIDGFIRPPVNNFEMCVKPLQEKSWLLQSTQGIFLTADMDCKDNEWDYNNVTKQISYRHSPSSQQKCLEILAQPSEKSPFDLQISNCDKANENQKFVYDEIQFGD